MSVSSEPPEGYEHIAQPYDEFAATAQGPPPDAVPLPEPPPYANFPETPKSGRSLKAVVAIVGISAVFAGGFFTGSYFPLKPGESTPPSSNDEGGLDAVDIAAAPPTYTPYTLADYGTGPCAPSEGSAEPVYDFADAPALCIDTAAAHTAVFDTSAGTIRVALDAANTPGTVNNFVNLARYGYYNNTLIHRSDPSIGILQGGSPHTNDATDPGPGYTVWDEGSGFTYRPGQLVMARTADPNSANAQYFFTVTESAALLDTQGTYVVFGEVIEGLDVLNAVLDTHLAEEGNDFGGTPSPPVTVNTITIQSPPDTASSQNAGLYFYPYTLADYGTGPCAPSEGSAEPVYDFADAPALCIDTAAAHTAVFDTSAGTIRVALDAANTPGTVNNFVNLARYGYYNNTLIHRSDPSIGILQGGSPHTNDATDPGPGYTVWDEGSGFTYRPGQLVMARTADPNSANAQYFFTVTESAALLDTQGTYVVFGEVIEGLDVLNAVLDTHLAEEGNDFGGTPSPPVTVNTITIQSPPDTSEPTAVPEEGQDGEQPAEEAGP